MKDEKEAEFNVALKIANAIAEYENVDYAVNQLTVFTFNHVIRIIDDESKSVYVKNDLYYNFSVKAACSEKVSK